MKRYDCFMLADELDLLECRLVELDPVVDVFVLVEAPVTHTGHPKPLWYADHADRFRPWHKKIRHIVADLPPKALSWRRENAQREQIARGLGDVQPDDVVMVSDADEFLSEALARTEPTQPIAWEHDCYVYAIDLLDPNLCRGTVMARGRDVKCPNLLRTATGFHEVRRGGWHFSWLGEPARLRRKLESCAATEHRGLDIETWSVARRHPFDRPLRRVDVGAGHPKLMREGRFGLGVAA